MDPNQSIAEAAADAVNPTGNTQSGILGKLQGKSPADAMLNKHTHGAVRQVPGMDMDGDFASKLDHALAAKAAEKAGQAPTPQQETQEPATQVQPPAPRDPLAPPKIGKHGHIRQLKEGMAAKEQGWEAEKATLLKELETLKAPKPLDTNPKFDEIIKENERLQRELTLLDITKSPGFASKFDQPRNVTIKQAKNIAGDKGNEVEVILSMSPGIIRDQKLEELLGDLPASTAAIVKAANNKLAEIDFSKQVEIETAKAGLDDHLKQQERLGLIQKQQQEQEFNELARSWATEVDALNPAKNKNAMSLIETAKRVFDGGNMSPKERAAASLQAALLPALLEEHNAAQAEIQRLQTALHRYEGGLPDGGSTYEAPNVPSVPRNEAERTAAFERGLDDKMRRDPTWANARRGRLY